MEIYPVILLLEAKTIVGVEPEAILRASCFEDQDWKFYTMGFAQYTSKQFGKDSDNKRNSSIPFAQIWIPTMNSINCLKGSNNKTLQQCFQEIIRELIYIARRGI